MKLKTLKKKIRRLETRLQEGPQKLARLKRKLAAQMKAEAAASKKKTTARSTTKGLASPATISKQRRPAAKTQAPSANKIIPAAPPKVKRTLNLSPERRAQLSEAMKARWAVRKATIAMLKPEEPPPTRDLTPDPAAEGS